MAAQESLASASRQLSDGENPGLLSMAQDAFTSGMQVTSFIAAAILILAAITAWRLIPSEPISTEKDDK